MLRSALAIAAVGVALAWFLAHSALPNRAAVAAAFRAIEGTAPQPALPPRPITPVAAAPNRGGLDANAFAIDSDRYGQYQTSMIVAGRELPALIDTGAFSVLLSYDAASSIGLHPLDSDFRIKTTTANGVAWAAPVTLASIRVGNVEARNVPAIVSKPGVLATTNLLGMTFLNRLSGFEIQSGRLVLRQ